MAPSPDLLSAHVDSRADGALLAFAAAALAIEGIALDQRSLRQVARTVGRLRPEAEQPEQSEQPAQPATDLLTTPACPEAIGAAFTALLQACQ